MFSFLFKILFRESLLIDVIPFATSFLLVFTILTAWLTVKSPSTSLTPTTRREAPFCSIARQAPSSNVICPTVLIAWDNQLFLLPTGLSTGWNIVPIFFSLKIFIKLFSFLPSANWTSTPPFVAISAAINFVVIPPVPHSLL